MNVLVGRLVFAGVFLLLAGYGYVTLTGPQGVAALDEKRQQIRNLEEENTRLARENETKREHNRKLEESASVQDLEIQQKTKKVHENETEFILPKSSTPDVPATETPVSESERR